MVRGDLFWFPERRTGLIYLDKPTTHRSYVLRTAQSKRGGWVVQIVRPLSRSVCYDVPEKDAAGLFSLVGVGSGETLLQWQLDPNLLPRPGDGPHVLVVSGLQPRKGALSLEQEIGRDLTSAAH